MPNREMDKIEASYDLWQWLKVTMALRKLKAETRRITEAIADTADHALGVGHLVKRLEQRVEDIIVLEPQRNHMNAVMSLQLKDYRQPAIDKSLP